LPRLSVLYNDYRDHGFVALAINLSEDMETVVKVYARQNTNPYLRDNGSVWPVYTHNNAIPLNYVVDTAGVIRFWQEGFNEEAIKQVIEQYLPGQIEHDVGVMGIASPAMSVDSGVAVTPACSVFNYANNVETYPVRMRIGTEYDTVAMVTDHQPNTTRYVEFPAWTPQARGSAAVTCTTELAGDDIGGNNAARRTLTVNVYDVAVTAIFAPADSVDSGSVVLPSVELWNFGTMSDMAKVKFYVGSSYVDSLSVALLAGRCDTATLHPWTALELGTFPVRCTVTTFRPDMNLANNLLTGSVRVKRASGVEERPAAASGFALLQAGPNPAGPRTLVRYSLARTTPVDLRVYSSNGKLVRTLRSGTEPAGLHEVTWDGRDELGRPVSRGAYFCRMIAGSFQAVRKLTQIE